MKPEHEIRAGLARLGEVFSREINTALLEIYAIALKDFTGAEIRAAFNRSIIECKFFPKPSELREFLTGSEKNRALIAWDKLMTAIESHGYNRSIAFDDPAIHSAVRLLGGWRVVCQDWDRAKLTWHQKAFTEAYSAAAGMEHPAYLVGGTEADHHHLVAVRNQDGDLYYPSLAKNIAPRLIGNPEKAKMLMETAKAAQIADDRVIKLLESI